MTFFVHPKTGSVVHGCYLASTEWTTNVPLVPGFTLNDEARSEMYRIYHTERPALAHWRIAEPHEVDRIVEAWVNPE